MHCDLTENVSHALYARIGRSFLPIFVCALWRPSTSICVDLPVSGLGMPNGHTLGEQWQKCMSCGPLPGRCIHSESQNEGIHSTNKRVGLKRKASTHRRLSTI